MQKQTRVIIPDTHPIAFSHWDLPAGMCPVFTNHLSLKLGAVNTFQYLAWGHEHKREFKTFSSYTNVTSN